MQHLTLENGPSKHFLYVFLKTQTSLLWGRLQKLEDYLHRIYNLVSTQRRYKNTELGGKMAVKGPAKSLPVHCGGSRFLSGRPGKAPDAQSLGTGQASRAGRAWEAVGLTHTDIMAPLPDLP